MEAPPPILPADPSPQTPARMSLAARLLNVFAVPGDVFEDLKNARASIANWLLPLLLTTVMTIVTVVIASSQPAIRQQIREKQDQMIQKQVKAGNLTQAQADQQMAMIEKFSGPLLGGVGGAIGGMIYGAIRIFGWATAMWLIARWMFRLQIPYMKTAEAVGLAGMIGILSMLVLVLLQVNFSNIEAAPNLVPMVNDPAARSASNVVPALAYMIFDIWQICILTLAFSRLTGLTFNRAAFPLFAIWFLLHVAKGLFVAVFGQLMG